MHRPITSQIVLPVRLAALVAKDTRLDGAIKTAAADFSEWLADNKTPFFPEYTDHGVAHVTNVLASAEAIISEEAWPLLTPEDSAALIASGLLHDCAMHLSQDGFAALLKNEPCNSKFILDSSTWEDEFEQFIQEAARWDRAKLLSVLGEDEPIVDPRKNLKNIEDRQKLLIGEFLRRHHARLAHEFALNGVPGPKGNCFHPFKDFSEELRDLFGFIARSHNVALRKAVDRLPSFSRSVWMQTHVPFVMAVLRIADYIQIDSQRAGRRLLQLRSLRSPVSRLEWSKHHAVQDLHNFGTDPEALVVNASPPDIVVFSGLRGLFADIQREIDEVWATLGEVYGRLGGLAHLGIRIRRLRSSLDDVGEFQEKFKPPYVPREVKLTTASAELLHLLVVPLYGARPSVGVRELLQNALDACSERAAFVERHYGRATYTADISVNVDRDGDAWALRIADNGCGMTLQTVEDFFLKAGASFRRSQWWRSEFLTPDGHATVRRTGRFGVGVLAAFLVGQRVKVETRHFLDQSGYGYEFELSLNNELIELRQKAMEVGTRISIDITHESVIHNLLSPEDCPAFNQWHLASEPEIEYSACGPMLGHAVRTRSRSRSSDEVVWKSIHADGFGPVAWTYDVRAKVGQSRYNHERHFLACNGIFVCHPSRPATLDISSAWSPFRVDHPTLVVEDRDGRLPLTMQRNGLASSTYPFQQELVLSIADAFVEEAVSAFQLPVNPSHLSGAVRRIAAIMGRYGDRYYYSRRGLPTVVLSKSGWSVFEDLLIKNVGPATFVVEMTVPGGSMACDNASISDLNNIVFLPAVYDAAGVGNAKHFFRAAAEDGFFQYVGLTSVAGAIFVHRDVESVFGKDPKIPKFLINGMSISKVGKDWNIFSFGGGIDASLSEKVNSWLKGSGARVLAVLKTQKVKGHESSETALSAAWLARTGGPFISKGRQGKEKGKEPA